MNHHLKKILPIAGLFISGFAVSALLARPGVVQLTDGQRIEGEITRDDPGQVTMSIRGIETVISRDRIASVAYTQDPAEEFQSRRKALSANDAAGRIALARWAFDNRLYSQAREVLDDVLDNVDPNSAEAQELQTLVRRQIELERRSQQQQAASNGQTGADQMSAPEANPNRAPVPTAENQLNAQQIMLIKIGETHRGKENNLRLSVPADMRTTIIKAENINSRTFENLSALDKLDLVTKYFSNIDDLNRVKLTGNPAVMQYFQQQIQPTILAGCASAGCHNTPAAGNFMLFERAGDERTTYTNFLILQQYVKQGSTADAAGGAAAYSAKTDGAATADGIGAGGAVAGTSIFGDQTHRVAMLDRQRPQDSLLLQYMLPSDQTANPHPPARGFRPLVRDRSDRRYVDVLRWISSLNPISPDYQISYTPPQKPADTSGPTTAPTTAPAGVQP
ncbi:MAG: hypothetical protein IT448_03815 [Phycisphaerales bacterium]|nr:hypothetical protein [Phycisphaerales bacterium]